MEEPLAPAEAAEAAPAHTPLLVEIPPPPHLGSSHPGRLDRLVARRLDMDAAAGALGDLAALAAHAALAAAPPPDPPAPPAPPAPPVHVEPPAPPAPPAPPVHVEPAAPPAPPAPAAPAAPAAPPAPPARTDVYDLRPLDEIVRDVASILRTPSEQERALANARPPPSIHEFRARVHVISSSDRAVSFDRGVYYLVRRCVR